MKKITLIAALAALVGTLTVPARATETDTILLGDRVVMRIRAGVNGESPSDRADAIRERLASILPAVRGSSAAVSVRQDAPSQDAAVYIDDKLVIRVDETLAQANRMEDPRDLALIWARNLRSALPQAETGGHVARR
jgi:hypothetical protein